MTLICIIHVLLYIGGTDVIGFFTFSVVVVLEYGYGSFPWGVHMCKIHPLMLRTAPWAQIRATPLIVILYRPFFFFSLPCLSWFGLVVHQVFVKPKCAWFFILCVKLTSSRLNTTTSFLIEFFVHVEVVCNRAVRQVWLPSLKCCGEFEPMHSHHYNLK